MMRAASDERKHMEVVDSVESGVLGPVRMTR
jgi:hypothetical protein